MSTGTESAGWNERRGVRHVRIDGDDEDQRIDNFLARELKGVPRARIYRLLRRGEVRVNGGRVRARYRLRAGDEVRLPPVRLRPPPGRDAPRALIERLERSILYEDKRLLVIDKPSGVAVHGGSGVSHGVIEALRAAHPHWRRLSLVHRLDRETSGCLVLAKRRNALRALHALFRAGRVSKTYTALVVGDWQLGNHLVEAPLEVGHRHVGERHVRVSEDGKRSATRFARLSRHGECTLVSAAPLTGRTHQIRVHAAHAGHPLALDERYGDERANERLARAGLKRLFLHAQSIAFTEEGGHERLFSAPLAEDLAAFLEVLGTAAR